MNVGEGGTPVVAAEEKIDPPPEDDDLPKLRRGESGSSIDSKNDAGAGLRKLGYNDNREFKDDLSLGMFPLIGFSIPDLHQYHSVFKLSDPIISMATPQFDLHSKILHMKTSKALFRVKECMKRCKIKFSDLLQRSDGLLDDNDKQQTCIPLGLILKDAKAIDTMVISTIQRLGPHILDNAVWVRRRIQHILFSLETVTPSLDPDNNETRNGGYENDYIRIMLIDRYKRMEERISSLPLDLSDNRNNQILNGLSEFEKFIHEHETILKTESQPAHTARIQPQENTKLMNIISIMKLYDEAYDRFIDKFHLGVKPISDPSAKEKDILGEMVDALDNSAAKPAGNYMRMNKDARHSEVHLELLSEFLWGFLIERFELLWCNIFTIFQLCVGGPCYNKIEKMTDRFMKQAIFSCMSHAFKLHMPPPPPPKPPMNEHILVQEVVESEETQITNAFASLHGIFKGKSASIFSGIGGDNFLIDKYPFDVRDSYLNKIKEVLHQKTVPIRLNYLAVLHDISFPPMYNSLDKTIKDLKTACSCFVDTVISNGKWKVAIPKKGYYRYCSNPVRDNFITKIRQLVPGVLRMGLEACRANIYDDPSVAALITLRLLNQTELERSVTDLYNIWHHPFRKSAATSETSESSPSSRAPLGDDHAEATRKKKLVLIERPSWTVDAIGEDNKTKLNAYFPHEIVHGVPGAEDNSPILKMLNYDSTVPQRPRHKFHPRRKQAKTHPGIKNPSSLSKKSKKKHPNSGKNHNKKTQHKPTLKGSNRSHRRRSK